MWVVSSTTLGPMRSEKSSKSTLPLPIEQGEPTVTWSLQRNQPVIKSWHAKRHSVHSLAATLTEGLAHLDQPHLCRHVAHGSHAFSQALTFHYAFVLILKLFKACPQLCAKGSAEGARSKHSKIKLCTMSEYRLCGLLRHQVHSRGHCKGGGVGVRKIPRASEWQETLKNRRKPMKKLLNVGGWGLCHTNIREGNNDHGCNYFSCSYNFSFDCKQHNTHCNK